MVTRYEAQQAARLVRLIDRLRAQLAPARCQPAAADRQSAAPTAPEEGRSDGH